MSSASFGTVNATGLNVTGILQASDIRTTQPMTVANLNLGGNVQVTVKGETVNTTNSMFGDMLATTQSGRTALAKALNFGTNANVFAVNGYTPLLSNGYSGKGVLLGHCESAIQFRVAPLRHIVAPEHIYSTTSNSFNALQNINQAFNYQSAPHSYSTAISSIGFDMHAKLADADFFQINLGGWPIKDPDAFVVGAGYNADMVDIQITTGDGVFYEQYPDNLQYFQDVWVELIEKAFLRGVKVSTTSLSFTGTEGYYYQFGTSGDNYTGINNPMSYIASLAADHDMVYCQSSGNRSFASISELPSPGSGRIKFSPADARNILTVATKLINDGTVYPVIDHYVSGSEYVSHDNYIVDKDYTQINYYKDDVTGNYSTKPSYENYTREVGAANGYGRTVDIAGPGRTHRCKPDIISAQGSNQAIFASTQSPGVDYVYSRLLDESASVACPTIAGGVCVLREALPLYDAHQIRECIMLSASNGDLSDADTDVGLGYGLVNLEAALAYGLARPQKMPPSLEVGDWEYSAGFQANIVAGSSNTLSPFQPFTQFEVASNTFSPKSVQSFKCPQDTPIYGSNVAYQEAYDAYSNLYDTYVASASNLWTAGVLDLSPAKGDWGSSAIRDIGAREFKVTSARSWISVDAPDVQEIKDLMIANGVKVGITSKLLGAFSVTAESPEQLSAIVNGNTKIRHVTPVLKLKPVYD